MPGLFVPKTVSFSQRSKRGYIHRGTKAFVLQGTRLRPGLSKRDKGFGLRILASEADYFTKPLSTRNKRIRAILEKYGVRTEKVLMELGNGRALFEKEGTCLASHQGMKIFRKSPQKIIKKLQETFAIMSTLEITHWHPHMGNFAVSPKGEIIVLDLGMATMLKNPEKLKTKVTGKEVHRISVEASKFCEDLTRYYYEAMFGRRPTKKEGGVLKLKLWKDLFSVAFKVSADMEVKLTAGQSFKQ
jgi:hypothetical protein